MDELKIKPCPFCGSTSASVQSDSEDGNVCAVTCHSCNGRGPGEYLYRAFRSMLFDLRSPTSLEDQRKLSAKIAQKKAIEGWNRRA